MKESPLGRRTESTDRYSPGLLFPVSRDEGRRSLGLDGPDLPFAGVDIWNAHEISWLNMKGKPVAATGEIRFPATSPNIIESKSLKLYLNSLGGMRHESDEEVARLIAKDLESVAGAETEVRLQLDPSAVKPPAPLPGVCIDDLDVEIMTYDLDPGLLAGSTTPGQEVEETLHSHLLKTTCPVTGQPDWAGVLIRYRGDRIDRAALLRYLISFRNHAAFHETCVERMFVDILRVCGPTELTIHARYTRRGGLDINPFRSSSQAPPPNSPTWRQ